MKVVRDTCRRSVLLDMRRGVLLSGDKEGVEE